jgi:hypothetical protein
VLSSFGSGRGAVTHAHTAGFLCLGVLASFGMVNGAVAAAVAHTAGLATACLASLGVLASFGMVNGAVAAAVAAAVAVVAHGLLSVMIVVKKKEVEREKVRNIVGIGVCTQNATTSNIRRHRSNQSEQRHSGSGP